MSSPRRVRRKTSGRRVVARFALALAAFASLALAGAPARADDPPAADQPDKPLVDTPAGRQAFEDVRAAYAQHGSSVVRSREAAQALGSKKPEERAWAAEYLVALFKQTTSDQENAKTPRGRGMKLGPGPQDDGASIRWIAIGELKETSIAQGSTEALAPALWLRREAKGDAAQSTAMWLLMQIRHPDADAEIVAAVKDEDSSYDVLERALLEVAVRKLPGVEAAVRGLCLHHVPAVREAAASAAKALGLRDVPVWSETSPLFPSLARRLKDTAARALPAAPKDAKWIRVRSKPDPEHPNWKLERFGWRLPDRRGKAVMLDAFGDVEDAGGEGWEVLEDTLADAAERLVGWREAFDALDRNDFDGRRAIETRLGLSRFGDYSGRTWEGILPEALLAAWAAERGDVATARELILPLLDKAGGEAAFFARMRDEQAVRLDERMLEAFVRTEYGRALRLARHLASPLFADAYAHERATALAEELPRRGDDFGALALPSEEAWKATSACLSRDARVAFLAARLRLIRARQQGIPGGISYGDDQLLPAADDLPWNDPTRARFETINPFVELLRMDLSGREIGPLLPLLRSREHILAFDLERFGEHRPQTLHRVAWVAGTLLDAIAGESVIDAAVMGDDAKKADAEVERLRAWFLARGDETRSDRLAKVALDRPWKEAERAFRSLAGLSPERAAATAAARAEKDAEHREALVRLVANLGGKEQVAAARLWTKDADAKVAFFGAWILVRHGDRAAREGIDALLSSLRGGEGWKLRDAVLDDLVATGDAAAKAYVDAAADPKAPEGAHPSLFLLQRRLLAGDAAALARVLDALDGKGLPMLEETPGDDRHGFDSAIESSEGVAAAVFRWRSPDESFPWGRPDDVELKAKREAIRVELSAWLRGEGDLLRAGKPTAIRPMKAPALRGDWGWISSGWVRRL